MDVLQKGADRLTTFSEGTPYLGNSIAEVLF